MGSVAKCSRQADKSIRDGKSADVRTSHESSLVVGARPETLGDQVYGLIDVAQLVVWQRSAVELMDVLRMANRCVDLDRRPETSVDVWRRHDPLHPHVLQKAIDGSLDR